MVKIMNQDQDLDLYFMMICRCSMGVFIPVSKFFCFGKKQAFKGIAPPSPNDCSIKSPLSHVLSLKLHLKLPLRISLDLFHDLSLNVSLDLSLDISLKLSLKCSLKHSLKLSFKLPPKLSKTSKSCLLGLQLEPKG